MRHFKLENSSGEERDITTTSVLFHEISGLGFEEENSFKRIADSWVLNKSDYNQGTISGKILFNAGETLSREDDPYYKYLDFSDFITKSPLILKYYPYGVSGNEDDIFYRKVRVSKLAKSEKNEYGVLDCDIDFTSYTSWYQIETFTYTRPDAEDDDDHWVWDTPVIFEPSTVQISGGAIPAKFAWEEDQYFEIQLKGLQAKAPTKLTIWGPLLNPYWTHGVLVGNTIRPISSGSFSDSETISIDSGDRLVIDNTDGNYSITKVTASGQIQNLYPYRDFGTECFVSMSNGRNVIYVGSSASESTPQITAEVHKLYATV